MHTLWEKLKALYGEKSSSFNMWTKEIEQAMTHVNMFNRVLTELPSQNLNFEEVKTLTLFSSLP